MSVGAGLVGSVLQFWNGVTSSVANGEASRVANCHFGAPFPAAGAVARPNLSRASFLAASG